MEDNVQDVEVTEVKPDREMSELSIRATLEQQLKNSKDDSEVEENVEEESTDTEDDNSTEEQTVAETAQSAEPVKPVEATQANAIPRVPPADMNQIEKEAYLNPNPQNAHIIQEYLNRRAYETKVQYDRKMQEVNRLREQTSSLYDTIKQYEEEYARDGLSIADITKRSIAWDKAMQSNPTEAALQWLDSYGLTPEDLANYRQQEPVQQNYLTREDAERIAEERYKALAESEQKKAVEYYNQRVVQSFMSQKPMFRDPETASQLEAEMAPVVQALTSTGRYSSPEEILETAYNYVVNGNPTFASIAQKIVAKPAIEQQQAAVQKAKAASKSISGSTGSGTPRIVTKDIRDNLRRRMSGE